MGRELEVAQVTALLRRKDVRLLTLTGPGGVGKTRLALAAAVAVAAEFTDGLCFISLAAVREHRLVGAVLARELGVQEMGTLPWGEQIGAVAQDLQALFLIDNFEHVLPAGPLLTELLAVCPRLTLLVTSRERLRLSGERDIPVHPLPCPDPERLPPLDEVATAPAVRLFVERAQAVDPGFALTDTNAAAVCAICHRLDGLPLALELAAARSLHLAPPALLARLAYRLPLLIGGPRDVPARLRTMRDAIAWSYGLLDPQEQSFFRRMAVFEGGFTLSAAEVMMTFGASHPSASAHQATQAADSVLPASGLDAIASLIDKSLVRRTGLPAEGNAEPPSASEMRFEMLETIREFGLERLSEEGEDSAVRTVHAAYLLALADGVTGPRLDETAGFDRLEAEHANLRVALAWSCASGIPATALRLAVALAPFWLRRGYHLEGRDWLRQALAAAPDEDPAVRAAALNALGDLLRELGAHSEAQQSFEIARDLAQKAGDRPGLATALAGLSALGDDVSDEAARALCVESVAIWRELGERRGLGRALHGLGWFEVGRGNVAAGAAHFEEALHHARAVGDFSGIAHALNSLGNLRGELGQFASGRPFLEEGLAVARRTRDLAETGEALADLGWLSLEMGDIPAARGYLAECLDLLRGSGRQRHAVYAIEACAVLAAADGRQELTRNLVAAMSALREEMGVPVDRDPRFLPAGPSPARERLRQFAGASRDGQCWSMDEAFREAETLVAASKEAGADPAARCGLTPREVDVLRLLIEGRSDRAIADALFVGRRTASKHVGAILAKLGVASRAGAVARALHEGLV